MITLTDYERNPALSELKVSYRRGGTRPARARCDPDRISSPQSAADYLRRVWDRDTIELREEFLVVCLTAQLEVLGWVKLACGGTTTATVDPRLVFAVALQTASAGLLVAHNHPSGSLIPSPDDVEMTRRLSDGARLLGLRLVDHVILTRGGAYSFSEAQNGLG